MRRINHMMEIIKFKGSDYFLELALYANGRTAIRLYTDIGELYMVATTNMPDVKLDDDEVIIKNYSENTGILDALISSCIISEPVRVVCTGFVTCPVCKLLTT
jgi:hypothetical protein